MQPRGGLLIVIGEHENQRLRELCMSYVPFNWALVVQGFTIAAGAFDCWEGN